MLTRLRQTQYIRRGPHICELTHVTQEILPAVPGEHQLRLSPKYLGPATGRYYLHRTMLCDCRWLALSSILVSAREFSGPPPFWRFSCIGIYRLAAAVVIVEMWEPATGSGPRWKHAGPGLRSRQSLIQKGKTHERRTTSLRAAARTPCDGPTADGGHRDQF